MRVLQFCIVDGSLFFLLIVWCPFSLGFKIKSTTRLVARKMHLTPVTIFVPRTQEEYDMQNRKKHTWEHWACIHLLLVMIVVLSRVSNKNNTEPITADPNGQENAKTNRIQKTDKRMRLVMLFRQFNSTHRCEQNNDERSGAHSTQY